MEIQGTKKHMLALMYYLSGTVVAILALSMVLGSITSYHVPSRIVPLRDWHPSICTVSAIVLPPADDQNQWINAKVRAFRYTTVMAMTMAMTMTSEVVV
jgi:hypothetical protein